MEGVLRMEHNAVSKRDTRLKGGEALVDLVSPGSARCFAASVDPACTLWH